MRDILGAGTAGCLVANMLSHKLDASSWRLTVIDRADKHVYQPGLLFLPFKLYGYENEDDVVRNIRAPLLNMSTLALLGAVAPKSATPVAAIAFFTLPLAVWAIKRAFRWH